MIFRFDAESRRRIAANRNGQDRLDGYANSSVHRGSDSSHRWPAHDALGTDADRDADDRRLPGQSGDGPHTRAVEPRRKNDNDADSKVRWTGADHERSVSQHDDPGQARRCRKLSVEFVRIVDNRFQYTAHRDEPLKRLTESKKNESRVRRSSSFMERRDRRSRFTEVRDS